MHTLMTFAHLWSIDPSEARDILEFPELLRYAKENRELPPRASGRVVFFGDSITELWGDKDYADQFFPDKPYINRGIKGQTSERMLARFRQDVISLHPETVVIQAGTNDIQSLVPQQITEDSIRMMVDLAQINGIRVILCSVLPAIRFPIHPEISPAEKIKSLNVWLRDYATKEKIDFVDYYGAMVDATGAISKTLTWDGVHPNATGYRVMESMITSQLTP